MDRFCSELSFVSPFSFSFALMKHLDFQSGICTFKPSAAAMKLSTLHPPANTYKQIVENATVNFTLHLGIFPVKVLLCLEPMN